MIRCRECVFWTEGNDRGLDGFGGCRCPRFRVEYHPRPDVVTPDAVVVEADEGWGFYVGPEFGCIHGVKRDA